MPRRTIFTILFAWLCCAAPALAAAGGHDHLPAHAEEIFNVGPFVITNSMLMVWIVAAFIILVAQLATKKLSL